MRQSGWGKKLSIASYVLLPSMSYGATGWILGVRLRAQSFLVPILARGIAFSKSPQQST